ncbi:MAG: metallopeptidase family protein [Defluviicoccus sp.]|nr:metallopeptidase family protein [Defluviicoccus sp.]MDE0383318.1 metallopeptidase family protein [Defluviicoccus sp.]
MASGIHAPSLDEIAAIARQAFDALPAGFRRLARDVVIQVAEFPDEDTEREMELASPFDLLGLYQGVPIGERDGAGTRQDVDMIFLYRRPMLDYWCETGEELGHVIRHVLIHEIGHHFGLSDDDMERIEEEAEP